MIPGGVRGVYWAVTTLSEGDGDILDHSGSGLQSTAWPTTHTCSQHQHHIILHYPSERERERKLLHHSPVGPTRITRYQVLVLMEFWNLICIASILGFWYLQLLRRSFPDVQLCYDLVSNPTFVRFPLIQPDRPDWPKLGIKLLSLLIDPNEVPNWQ